MHDTPKCRWNSEKEATGYTFLQRKQSWGRCIRPNGTQIHCAHIQQEMTPSGLVDTLDIAARNPWIVYKKASCRKIFRRNFILQLIEGLRRAYVAQKVTQENTAEQASVQLEIWKSSGKRRKCAGEKCNNHGFCLPALQKTHLWKIW